MDPLATSRAYELLAELISRGLSPETREAALMSPSIAAAIAGYASEDAIAADHQHVFGFAVHPYEGAFLDPDGAAGASRADALAESYRRIGYRVDPRGDDAEHLATELRALAFLCAAEADARDDGLPEVAARMRRLQRDFLATHLARWLPPFAGAVLRCARPFPAALVAQLTALVDLHDQMGDGELLDQMTPRPPFDLSPVPDVVGDEGSGLAEIARFLTTPARSGIFLSRDDIAAIARSARVPRGFGERSVMLENALRAAAHLDELQAVLENLTHLLARARADAPEPWRTRLGETIAVVRRIAARAAEGFDAREDACA